jgi:hypothetical protein
MKDIDKELKPTNIPTGGHGRNDRTRKAMGRHI